ncbi:MAG TPA: glycosyltransferase family 4 protein [Solirubrobacteraceae bacterium]|nr:glycosyltransferase family 4 protein [Solirubrobacteraceae bacterium]
MVLFLHNRYRTTGGEERVVEDLLWLVREHLEEPAELLARDSALLAGATAAAGLLNGGLGPGEVARAVRLTRARVVHAHNLLPTFGWRALAAARAAGARVVLHLHQYRLVCATGVCFTRGAECTRCHGANTLPGVRLRCRGSMPEALAYGASLALWQRRTVAQVDAVIVPSAFARERLRELGAPLPWERVHVLAPPVRVDADAGDGAFGASGEPGARAASGTSDAGGEELERLTRPYALVVSRLSPEKGVDVAIDACRMAGIPLAVAGEGPQLAALRERVRGADVSFLGHLDGNALTTLRDGAAVALAPSRAPETFGLAAAEAMAAGVPVVASRVGALPEIVEPDGLVQPGNARALAAAITSRAGDRAAGERGRRTIGALCSPEAVAGSLREIYARGGARASP